MDRARSIGASKPSSLKTTRVRHRAVPAGRTGSRSRHHVNWLSWYRSSTSSNKYKNTPFTISSALLLASRQLGWANIFFSNSGRIHGAFRLPKSVRRFLHHRTELLGKLPPTPLVSEMWRQPKGWAARANICEGEKNARPSGSRRATTGPTMSSDAAELALSFGCGFFFFSFFFLL